MAIRIGDSRIGGTDINSDETNFKSEDYNDTNVAVLDYIDDEVSNPVRVIHDGSYTNTSTFVIPSDIKRLKMTGYNTANSIMAFTINGQTATNSYIFQQFGTSYSDGNITYNDVDDVRLFLGCEAKSGASSFADYGLFDIELVISGLYITIKYNSNDRDDEYIFNGMGIVNTTAFGTIAMTSYGSSTGNIKVVGYEK